MKEIIAKARGLADFVINMEAHVEHGPDDSCGFFGCCGRASYSKHAPDCQFQAARELASELLNEIDKEPVT